MRVLNVVGARPNFVKIAPIIDAIKRHPKIDWELVHTGQHYDYQMSQAFFEDLAIPDATINLNVASGSHAKQTGQTMIAFEEVCLQKNPDLVLVVGDVNATVACSLAAKKIGIPIAHVEAGLRSGDMRMPEEINRRCTDAITDYFFTTEASGNENLLKEGVDRERIFHVGNVMIDSMFKHRANAAALKVWERFDLEPGNYALITLHRPSNTDDKQVLSQLLEAIVRISKLIPLIIPMHPRTSKAIERFELRHLVDEAVSKGDLVIIEPLRYLEFLGLMQDARMVLTDSGGLQEETTALGVPCLTLRENTERPITCSHGTNELVGSDPARLLVSVERLLDSPKPRSVEIDKWDGHASNRIVEVLQKEFAL